MTRDTTSEVVTESLGGSPLSKAIQQRALPDDILPRHPDSETEWRAEAERAHARAGSTWFSSLRPAFEPEGRAAERLGATLERNGVLVTTGQQAAIFGGPLYTLAKALSARAYADKFEAATGIAAAPVFWAATDDADFLEASTTWSADADGLHRMKLEGAPAAGVPMSHARMLGVRELAATLRRSSGSALNSEYLELALATFADGRSLGDAYVAFLRQLLEPLGIVVFDSSHPAYREAARPLLTRALSEGEQIAEALTERAETIRARGMEPQVQDDRGLSLVFALADGGEKRRIAIADAPRYLDRGVALTPNVLLRPIVEQQLMPTVAYVGGPGEIAYFSQCTAVTQALGLDQPVVLPRWSCTILEPFAKRALERLDADYRELRDVHTLERRLATRALPTGVASAWKDLQQSLGAGIDRLSREALGAGLLPREVLDGFRRSLEHRVQRAERRLLAAVKRRDEKVRRDIEVAAASLYPMGRRQERVLNFVPMLARGGAALLDGMLAEAHRHAAGTLLPGQSNAAAIR